jgi:hypothetical protein
MDLSIGLEAGGLFLIMVKVDAERQGPPLRRLRRIGCDGLFALFYIKNQKS